MDRNSMENDATVIEHSPTEQNRHGGNQQRENLGENQSDLKRPKRDIIQAEKTPMQPTPLEYSWWSTHPTETAVGAYFLFIVLAITIGVLIVCFTLRKSARPTCVLMLLPTVSYSGRYSSHPQSIAVGDFNNDGQMDIVVANFGFDNVGVLLGYGNNTFSSQTMYSTGIGSAPRMVGVDDFNHDNRSDIVVANFGINSIGIFLGDGDGNFQSQITIETTPSRPLCAAVDDLNNNGHPDIAFAGYGTSSVGVLLGFGNSTFRTPMNFSIAYDSLPYSVAFGDFNNDGQLDIAVANFGKNNVGILLGYGNGTFAIQMTYTTGANSHPYSVAISDLNNDTHLDIAVVNSKTNSLGVLFGHGNGSFIRPTVYSTGRNSNPISIVIANFNNDNRPDINVANNGTDSATTFLGYGDGTFADQITYSTGPRSGPYSIGVADFNNDNQLDIAVVNQQNNNIKIFNRYTNETFASYTPFPINNEPYSLDVSFSSTGAGSYPKWSALGDFNNDSRRDIAVTNFGTNNVGVLLGYSDGKFSSPMIYSTGNNSNPLSLAVGDLNKDGRLDIVVANYNTHTVGIFLAYGNGTFLPQITYRTGTNSCPSSVAIGDFNNDDQLDIAVTNYNTNNVGVLLGYGNGYFQEQRIFSTGVVSHPRSLAVGDFAVGNGLLSEENTFILLGNGNESFSSNGKYITEISSGLCSVIAGDFNRDSRLDIIVTASDSSSLKILLGHVNGTFFDAIAYSTGDNSYPFSLAVADFNDDDRLDVVVSNMLNDNIVVFLGYARGGFASTTAYQIESSSQPVNIAVGDFNNDACLDVVIADRVWVILIVTLSSILLSLIYALAVFVFFLVMAMEVLQVHCVLHLALAHIRLQ